MDPFQISVHELADFFLFLFHEKGLNPRTIKGYRSAISSTISSCGSRSEFMNSAEITSPIRSFQIERPPKRKIAPNGIYRWSYRLWLNHPSRQCLIQDKISTSPSPTDRRAVVAPRGRARSSHWAIFLLNNIAITNNSTFPKIKLHYSISYCNKTKSNNLI